MNFTAEMNSDIPMETTAIFCLANIWHSPSQYPILDKGSLEKYGCRLQLYTTDRVSFKTCYLFTANIKRDFY